MSARRTRLFAASSTFVATVALVGFGGSVASADPPALDHPQSCADSLDRVQQWPGRLTDDVQLVSDGFDSYLGRHTACQTET